MSHLRADVGLILVPVSEFSAVREFGSRDRLSDVENYAESVRLRRRILYPQNT